MNGMREPCECGTTPTIYAYVEMPLATGWSDAIAKTVSLCSGCLTVMVVDIAMVAPITVDA